MYKVKIDSKNEFQNSPPFERLACFGFSGNIEQFQYFIFETQFLENENLFQKTGVPFFRLKQLD